MHTYTETIVCLLETCIELEKSAVGTLRINPRNRQYWFLFLLSGVVDTTKKLKWMNWTYM